MAEAPDLLSLVLELRPLPGQDSRRRVPRWWGHAAQHLLLTTVSSANPKLGHELYQKDKNKPRPYAVSSLIGSFLNQKFAPGKTYYLNLTALNSATAEALLECVQEDGPFAVNAQVELDRFLFEVVAVRMDEKQHPWAGSASYLDLQTQHMMVLPQPGKRITLQFTSPTAFKPNIKHVPFPQSELVFGSLINRWNLYSDQNHSLSDELRTYLAKSMAVSQYELKTYPVPTMEGGMRIGGVGRVTYIAIQYDGYWMRLISMLAAFAKFAGAGVGTSMGMGRCRQISDGGKSPEKT